MYKMPLGSIGPKSNLTKKILGPTAPRSNLALKILGSVAPRSKRAGYPAIQNMQDQEKVLKYLVSVEKLAEEILADKHEIIMLDKRRNQNREALRDITKSSQNKCWLTVGSMLIKHTVEATKSLLEADQKQLSIDINKLRCDLKVKVNNLRDLEMQPPVPGLMLVPMSRKETEGLARAGLFSS